MTLSTMVVNYEVEFPSLREKILITLNLNVVQLEHVYE